MRDVIATTVYYIIATVDRATWQEQIAALRLREKAHTRAGDVIAAARRRLPMVEVDAATPVIGAHGEAPLIGSTRATATGRSWAGRCRGTPCLHPRSMR